MRKIVGLVFCSLAASAQPAIDVHVDAAAKIGPFKPIYAYFGYDEPNYTYSKHGKDLLRKLAELSPEAPRVRTHNLLSSGNGVPALKWGSTNAYT